MYRDIRDNRQLSLELLLDNTVASGFQSPFFMSPKKKTEVSHYNPITVFDATNSYFLGWPPRERPLKGN